MVTLHLTRNGCLYSHKILMFYVLEQKNEESRKQFKFSFSDEV